jgi:hypothetical protein
VICANCNYECEDSTYWHCEECRRSQDAFDGRRRAAEKEKEPPDPNWEGHEMLEEIIWRPDCDELEENNDSEGQS